MKTTHYGRCLCCEAKGLPARVTIEAEGENVSATCESHGPWLFFPHTMFDEIQRLHRETLAKVAPAPSPSWAPTPVKAEDVARAFEIADCAMIDRIETEGALGATLEGVYGLVDEDGREVQWLAEASASLQEAVEWLQPRGYVLMIPKPDGRSEFIHVLRRPE